MTTTIALPWQVTVPGDWTTQRAIRHAREALLAHCRTHDLVVIAWPQDTQWQTEDADHGEVTFSAVAMVRRLPPAIIRNPDAPAHAATFIAPRIRATDSDDGCYKGHAADRTKLDKHGWRICLECRREADRRMRARKKAAAQGVS